MKFNNNDLEFIEFLKGMPQLSGKEYNIISGYYSNPFIYNYRMIRLYFFYKKTKRNKKR